MEEFTLKAMLKMTAHYAAKTIEVLEEEEDCDWPRMQNSLKEVKDAMDKTVEAIGEYLSGDDE